MKKSEKGFTLIELLVVVAIIGILAAVGVVAYSGYTEGAKKSGAKSNHANVVKYIAAEMKKCNIGTDSGTAMKDPTGTDKLTCSQVGSAGEVAKAEEFGIAEVVHQPNHPCTNQPSRTSRNTQASWPVDSSAM